MSSCDDLRSELGGYVLGGLESAEEQLVEAHTSSCDRCRAELAELTATAQLLGALRPPDRPAPADLKLRVLDARRRSSRRRAPALVAAALVLAALAGLAAGTLLDRPPPPDAVVSVRGTDPTEIVGEAGLRQTPNGVQLELELAGLAAAERGYYHAWLHRGDRRVSAGTFVGTEQATARLQLLCGGQLDDYDRLTLTWHPFGDPDEIVAADADLL